MAILHLNEEFDAKRGMLEGKIVELEEAFSELKQKYESRESRQEDSTTYTRCKGLRRSRLSSRSKLRRRPSTKLELLNREDNFNKKFSRKPPLASSRSPVGPNGAGLVL